MSFFKSIFNFVADFIWDAQIIICPNSVYWRQNRPEQTHGWGKSVLRLDYYQLYKICNNTLVFSSGIYFISKKRKKKSILLSHYHEISYKPLNQDKYPVSQLIRNLVLELTNIWAKSVCTFIWVSLLIVEEHLLLLTYLFL